MVGNDGVNTLVQTHKSLRFIFNVTNFCLLTEVAFYDRASIGNHREIAP
jgi:hypothetical protein